jgi:hypothetical protein
MAGELIKLGEQVQAIEQGEVALAMFEEMGAAHHAETVSRALDVWKKRFGSGTDAA